MPDLTEAGTTDLQRGDVSGDVVAAIDHALADHTLSLDAMRWNPEHEPPMQPPVDTAGDDAVRLSGTVAALRRHGLAAWHRPPEHAP